MRYILVALNIMIVIQIANAQELIPFRIDDKWGYSNAEAEIVIPVIYDKASKFNPVGQAQIRKNRRSYCINKLGESVKCNNKRIGICGGVGTYKHKEVITYKKNGKIGLVSKRIRDTIINLNEIYHLDSLPILWDEFYQNYKTAAVRLDDAWGIIDINGNLLVDYKYDNIIIQGSMFITKKSNQFGLINDEGEIVTEPKYNMIEVLFNSDYVKVLTSENKMGFVSKNGLEYFEDSNDH